MVFLQYGHKTMIILGLYSLTSKKPTMDSDTAGKINTDIILLITLLSQPVYSVTKKLY